MLMYLFTIFDNAGRGSGRKAVTAGKWERRWEGKRTNIKDKNIDVNEPPPQPTEGDTLNMIPGSNIY